MDDKRWWQSKKFLGALVPTVVFAVLVLGAGALKLPAEVIKELVAGLGPMLGIVWTAQVGGQAVVDRERARQEPRA